MHRSYLNCVSALSSWRGIRASHPIFVAAFLLLISVTFIACEARDDKKSAAAPIVLFNGTGTSPNDVKAIEVLLRANHLSYTTANSSQLNQISESQLREYRLLIIPGGNFIEIGNGLSASTTVKIHNAVQNGLNYLGICAGGFLAGNINGHNNLNLTAGVKFGFYSAESHGVRKAPVAITAAAGPTLEHYWEDGPEFTGWGAVIAKYPDGTAAVVEGKSGSGWVILTGVHPEAPEAWRGGMTFTTPAAADNTYATTLIQAALNGTLLPHY